MYRTSGFFLGGEEASPAEEEAGLVGIVTDDLDDVSAYLRHAGAIPYVVIRSAADVPERLGGFAILSPELLTAELQGALASACTADPL